AYHTRLREAAAGAPAAGTAVFIHEQTRVKEPGLERFLRYDRWPRHAFRILIFDPSRTQADYETLQLRENAAFSGSQSPVKNSAAAGAELCCADSLLVHDKTKATAPRLLLFKTFSFNPCTNGFEVACEIQLKFKELLEKPVAVGIESVINFLAPTEP